VTLRFTSSDKHAGLSGFAYGINEEVKRHWKSSSGTTTITFTTPSTGSFNHIYVWAKDKAGNDSNRAVLNFFSARYVEATPVAAWRLDGDGLCEVSDRSIEQVMQCPPQAKDLVGWSIVSTNSRNMSDI
jgi:hypothetical protein